MTFQRDQVWQNLERMYRSSIACKYARYALGLDYQRLPEEVIHQAKCCLLDALGCAIGGYISPGRPMVEEAVREIGGKEEATVIGSGWRTTALNATLVNSFLVRFLEYNDMGGGGHNSDAIASILAVAEREKATGKQLLTSIVISYELGARFSDAQGGHTSYEGKGWTIDIRGGVTMPPALGKMMGLTERQIANAIGICASHALPLGILDTNREENTMSKNLRFGWVCHDAILACLLARQGFTGPVRILEGEDGLQEVIMKGTMDLEKAVDFSGWRILDTRYKNLCANGTSFGHISATLSIVKENDLRPEDIASVRIRTGLRESRHTGSLVRKYPRNAENANHSAYYASAIAIKERHFGPGSIEPEKLNDPIVLDLIEKITVEAEPDLSEHSSQGISEIVTRDGRRFEKRVDVPHGFADDPLTDEELENKFKDMALKYMSMEQVNQLIRTIWNIDREKDLNRLMPLMIINA
ncbi:MAG: MmgE/PrpD family protein [Dehalococcoidales bacterium]|nr:MmgE/PrpD family protein [Dehalococcoidales bacterium]